jgi:hypothetical protein
MLELLLLCGGMSGEGLRASHAGTSGEEKQNGHVTASSSFASSVESKDFGIGGFHWLHPRGLPHLPFDHHRKNKANESPQKKSPFSIF